MYSLAGLDFLLQVTAKEILPHFIDGFKVLGGFPHSVTDIFFFHLSHTTEDSP